VGRRIFSNAALESRLLRDVAKDADLVVISQGVNMDGLLWMEACQRASVPFVVIAQAAAEQWWPDDDLAERLAKAYEAAQAAFFVSDANLALSRQQFVTPLKKATVIRNPFNVSYEANPPWPADSSVQLRLACVGRLDIRDKGQDLLLGVLALPHWRDRSVELSIVGKGNNQRSLQRLTAVLGLQNVIFTGFVHDLQELWSRHHALVLPSRCEGMPLALVETMICNRPAIVTDVAGHRELVRDGINGLLAGAPTVALLDEAMNRAWSRRRDLKHMGSIAGADVRRWVSPDPTEQFVEELKRAARSPAIT
jgi:glycosyltransferase involved in cell wall biosynthesis